MAFVVSVATKVVGWPATMGEVVLVMTVATPAAVRLTFMTCEEGERFSELVPMVAVPTLTPPLVGLPAKPKEQLAPEPRLTAEEMVEVVGVVVEVAAHSVMPGTDEGLMKPKVEEARSLETERVEPGVPMFVTSNPWMPLTTPTEVAGRMSG